MDDWHQENALDLTSDVSSMDSDNSTVDRAETSTNSLKQKDLSLLPDSACSHTTFVIPSHLTTDCGVLNHSTTPTGHSSSSFVNFSRPSERLSISQPDLPTVRAAPRAIVAKLNVSAGNISHPFKKPPRTRVPLIKTLEENEALKEEIAILKSKLNLETYKVAELTSLQPRNIQDILDEYYSLQMSKYDVDKERKHIAEAKRQAQSDVELAEVRAQAKYEERIEKLEATIAEKEELPTSLDALKGEDSDWTIRSEGDIITDELRVRLTAIEKENNALRKKIEEQQLELAEKSLLNNTFVVGAGCDVEKLLQQIDNLEIRLHDEEEQHNKTSSALVAYMSRCHTLEKKLQNINLSCAHWSFNGHTKDEVLQVVNKLRNLLRSLGEKNKELREKCTKLLGLKDLSEITTSSTGFDGVVNVAGDVFEKSCLLIENFEEKQQEVINILKSLTDNVTDFDESVIKILRGIEATEASGEQSLHRDALANLINPNCQPNPCETATYQNLSMMGASLSELINRSLNTSKVIVNFQEKLGTLRGVMQRMFENLRTCGMLFEDILKNLGSENDEIRQLVDRIKSMKFECSNVLEESRLLLNVIEETSKSVSMMQLEMSAWEQSLNETSFRMDYSVVPRITHCRATQTVQANEEIDAENLQESLEIRALLSAKEKEIERLQTMIGKVK
ncbi:hypothetical protein DICVIV_09116 [Dictyocaulus viviparus]|uniref:Uncharacterized protein n=1 Tax=Dictyocaulus viviparus TaxID=29172 RepID=A0A0D8XR77_DICVI|nr:hypothetical protein DICVIV_09116 [Dictyocaulus viviparus]